MSDPYRRLSIGTVVGSELPSTVSHLFTGSEDRKTSTIQQTPHMGPQVATRGLFKSWTRVCSSNPRM